MSKKDEEHENEHEDYQNRIDSGEKYFEELDEYNDGYFSIDENTGELTHGPISIGRIVIINNGIYTDSNITDSEKSHIAGPF